MCVEGLIALIVERAALTVQWLGEIGLQRKGIVRWPINCANMDETRRPIHLRDAAMARKYSSWRLISTALGILVATVGIAQNVRATTYTFVTQNEPTLNVDWHTSSLWSPTPPSPPDGPDGIDDAAIFNRPVLAEHDNNFTVNLDTNTTLGAITVDNTNAVANHNLIIDSFGTTLTFQSSSGPATWTEIAGSTTGRFDMKPNINLASDLVITQDNDAGQNSSSFLRGLITGSSGRTITKEGLANLQLENNNGSGFQGQYIINNGGLRFTGNSNISQSTGITVNYDSGTNHGGQLQIGANGTWGLASGSLILNGPGKDTSTVTNSASEGALRFQLAANTGTATFTSPVELQTDSVVSVAAPGTTATLTGIVSGSGGLTKHGNGTLILDNASDSYAGDTHVLTAGTSPNISTLSLTNPVLPGGSDVYLSATRTALDLNFSATNIIDSLFFDDVSQATGTWGALGAIALGADHETSLITGTGWLQVTTFVPSGVAGDYNDDGIVDAADYVIWRKNEGTTNVLPHDPTGGTIGTAQYDQWHSNFGTSATGSGASLGAAAVPEPATWVLVLFTIPLLSGRKLGRIRT